MSVRFLKARRPTHEQNINSQWIDLYVDEERRQHERHPVKLTVKVSASHNEENSFSAVATTKDMSLGGLCFVTDRHTPSEGTVEIAVSTTGSDQALLPDEFHGVGTIVRTRESTDGSTRIGVTLGDNLRHNAEFAMFLTAAAADA